MRRPSAATLQELEDRHGSRGKVSVSSEAQMTRSAAGACVSWGAPFETSRQGLHNGPMTSDAACVEANVDYGNASGYMVRLDVEIPHDALAGRRDDGGPMGCLLLSHDEAERLGHQLLARAARVRKLRDGVGGQGTSGA